MADRKRRNGYAKRQRAVFGLGAGLAAGTVIGMMMPVGRTPMRTKMGKRIQKMGIAVDHTMDDILSNLR